MKNRTIQVCPTINLFNLYNIESKVVVIIDIFRATSSIVAGIGSGIPKIVTFKTPQSCYEYRTKGFITAGEENGKKVPYLDLGNSPVAFEKVGQSKMPIAFTTTNGAKAIALSINSKTTVIGAFLNLRALTNFLKTRTDSILLLCSGWRGYVNIEDVFFAGAICSNLESTFQLEDDMTFMSKDLYLRNNNTHFAFLKNGTHYKRLANWGNQKDIDYSLQIDRFDIVPELNKNIFSIA